RQPLGWFDVGMGNQLAATAVQLHARTRGRRTRGAVASGTARSAGGIVVVASRSVVHFGDCGGTGSTPALRRAKHLAAWGSACDYGWVHRLDLRGTGGDLGRAASRPLPDRMAVAQACAAARPEERGMKHRIVGDVASLPDSAFGYRTL